MDNGDPERIKNNKECRNSKKVMPKKKKRRSSAVKKYIFYNWKTEKIYDISCTISG